MENAVPADAASGSPPLLRLPAFSLPEHLRHPCNPPPTGPLPRPPSILENRGIAARLSAASPPLSPSDSLPNNSHNPSPVGRQPSDHTQASSDALGENYLPSRPLALPTSDRNSRKSSAIDTDCSGCSGSSLLASDEETDPLSKPARTSHFDRSVASLEGLQHDSRSLGRLSRLSYISGGAAFVVSEESEDLRTTNGTGRSYRINNVLPEFEERQGPRRVGPVPRDRCDLRMNGTLGNPGDSRLRIHPADNRFEHTYRMRKASETEEPIYVPVYSFEPPGKFPDRSRLTAPLATPKFLNHTPRNFSLPGRSDGNPAARSSSDSAEMLLGDTGKFDGIEREIKVPPRAYDARRRTLRPFGNPLSMKSSPPVRDKMKNGGQLFGKETAHRRFERERGHRFHDLNHLEESHWPAALIPPRIQTHGLEHPFSKYGIPTLGRPEDSYAGKEINEGRWPERYKRQKRIGRSLLCVCIAMPPLWLIMAAGLLDNLVAEMTGGEIWGVGRSEKVLAAWFGGTFCFALIVAIIVAGITVL